LFPFARQGYIAKKILISGRKIFAKNAELILKKIVVCAIFLIRVH
jgi:hypothetical protein